MNGPAEHSRAGAVSCLAVIPARGGSKGIPGKNLRPVAGAPLLAHAIRAARGAACVGRVVVSTDDDAIAAAARAEGADVVRRPAEISGDAASSESALLHALEQMAAEGCRPELLVFVQCTSPLTVPEDIDAAVETLRRKGADTALTATPFHGFVWREEADGNAAGVNHDKAVRLRRQDLPPEFVENGAVYVMKAEAFREKKHRFFGKTVLSAMPAERSLDIDGPEDLAQADRILSARPVAGEGESL
jgi:CMP-N-acetylneuraminic acid synthetase